MILLLYEGYKNHFRYSFNSKISRQAAKLSRYRCLFLYAERIRMESWYVFVSMGFNV